MGHHSQVNSLQRRARCWGIFRRRFASWSDQVGSAMYTSSHQQQDGDTTSDGHMDSPVRYTPYAIPSHHRRSSLYKQDQTIEREQKPLERRSEGKKQAQTSGNWFNITIPFGIKYDEEWLLNLIQRQCNVPFTPIEFHYEKMQAHFFVENTSIAFALKNVSGKIWDENDEKISIFVNLSDTPRSVKEMKLENVKQTKLLTLNPSHNKSYQLARLPDAMPKDPDISNLNMKTEVKFAGDVDQGKGLESEDIPSVRNSLCTTYLDKSSNINAVQNCFPTLLRLDGQELCQSVVTDVANSEIIKPCKERFERSETPESMVLQFLREYFLTYDYGDRQHLLSAYHDEACFSLTVPFNPKDPVPSSLREYLKHSRNMTQLKDSRLRRQLLRHTKRDIVDSLLVLPRTEHDFTCFMVDVWFQSETMLGFSVRGAFREVEGTCRGCVRTFTRTFIATPGSSSGLCIINDKLFVQDANPQGNRSAFPIPMPTTTPSFTSVPAIFQEQQRMVQPFSIQSRMNLACSQKYLHDNHYDYTRAVQTLTLPMAKGKTPDETLAQIYPGS